MWGKMTYEVNEKPLQLEASKDIWKNMFKKNRGRKKKHLKKNWSSKKNQNKLDNHAQKLKGNSTVKHYEDGALNTKNKRE